jgi:hypothetical protein
MIVGGDWAAEHWMPGSELVRFTAQQPARLARPAQGDAQIPDFLVPPIDIEVRLDQAREVGLSS